MIITVTFEEILSSGYWLEFCEKYDVNEWCVNEGLAESTDYIDIDIEDAKRYGFIGD